MAVNQLRLARVQVILSEISNPPTLFTAMATKTQRVLHNRYSPPRIWDVPRQPFFGAIATEWVPRAE